MNKNVLICVTGQKSCERLIDAGTALAREMGGTAYVLHVTRAGKATMGYADEPQALEYLLSVSVKRGADMVVVHSEDVQETIVRQARALEAGALVAGRARNYKGWDLLDELKLRLPKVKFVIEPQ